MNRYNLALESYLSALPVFEEFNESQYIASVYNGMAIIYEEQKFYDKAEEFYLKQLDIVREMNNQSLIALTLNNLGILFSNRAFDTITKIYGEEVLDTVAEEPTDKFLKYYAKGIDYLQQSLEISRELDNRQQIAQTLNNIGLNFLQARKLSLAIPYLEQALVISEELDDANEMAAGYQHLGQIYLYYGQYDRALTNLNQSLEYAQKINVLDILESVYLNMSSVYARMDNHRRALDYFKLHSAIRDSIKNKDMNQAMADMQVRYETEVLEKNNQLLTANAQLDGAQIKQQRILIFFFIFVLLAISAMVVLLIRQSNQRKRTNLELSQKNALITEQKKEITDSIHYASRIQTALLPPGDYIDKLIPERFILYLPRDIVSGDYYWLTEKNEKVICMAADCTGHGVPGAFMSMLGISFLNEIVSRHEDVHTDVILNELRAQVIKSLHQTGKEGGSQDGMDVALYILDFKIMTLEFSGANNPLFLFRNGEMIELKADKMPIGIHTKAHEPFTRHNLDIKKNDMIYTFSDGYPDQFGGPHQKKFMIKNFKKLLAEIHKDPPEAQKQALVDYLNSWMSEADQVDDIIVIGVRV
jgi:serine phosphatase RsbU (regulator of sigma subunit)